MAPVAVSTDDNPGHIDAGEADAATVGAVVLLVIVIDADAVHPFTSVTVTV